MMECLLKLLLTSLDVISGDLVFVSLCADSEEAVNIFFLPMGFALKVNYIRLHPTAHINGGNLMLIENAHYFPSH